MRKELEKYIAKQMLLWIYYILPECTFKIAYYNLLKNIYVYYENSRRIFNRKKLSFI